MSDTIPCVGCHTNCCQHYLVTVTAHDVYRIKRSLQMPILSFVHLHPTSDEEKGVHLDDGFFQVALRKRESDACVFLVEIDDNRRCGIQSFKPRVCAIYPFTIEHDDELWQREDMLCPVSWRLSWRDQLAMKVEIRRCREEVRFHEALVGRWNQEHPAGGPADEFVDFMLEMVTLAEGGPLA